MMSDMSEKGSGKTRVRPAIKAQAISTPKGGGAVTGLGETAGTDEQTGAFSVQIPLAPPGARGLEPPLVLTYRSTGGQGEFGLGFSLPVACISRQTARGTPHYNDRDIFLFESVELCPLADQPTIRDLDKRHYQVTAYRPRVEQAFASIEHWVGSAGQDFWRTIGGDSLITFYGLSGEARVADPDQSGRLFEWLVEWEFDAKGNAIHYRHKAENSDGVSVDSAAEANRMRGANRYIERICYANDAPLVPQPDGDSLPSDTLWHFEIVFDYGEYSVTAANHAPYAPVHPWTARPDPFSTYVTGFERRTHRLCQNILYFHRFDVLGQDPVLTRAVALAYHLDPHLSQLTGVTVTGYRHLPSQAAGQRYAAKSMPPLAFGYTTFNPGSGKFVPFEGLPVPGVEIPPLYSLTDLYGEGVPGILYGDGASMLYCSPQSSDGAWPVVYESPAWQGQMPSLHLGQSSIVLTDLDGDGCQELVSTRPETAGFFRAKPDRNWDAFWPLKSFPSDYEDAFSEFADLTGNGLSDLVQVRRDSVLYYEGMGTRGYEPPRAASNSQAVPLLSSSSPDVMTVFTDLLGAGGLQRVCVANGEIVCWPSLGFGRFGPPISLANAPRAQGRLDVSQVHLADLDGSGTSDVIIAYADHVEIFFNHAGNGFASTPLIVSLPALYVTREQISFADLFGIGCQCLVFRDIGPVLHYWAYDFCDGRKPHLLRTTDNGTGATTTVTYASSARFYLDDKKAGRPWITTLPFPVQVVAQHERVDAISTTREVSTYRYRHGYYDGVERQFHGFAMVERQDVETLTDSRAAASATPALERTWYHTGACPEAGPLSQLLTADYFDGDAQAYAIPPDAFIWPAGVVPSKEQTRQAHVALAGSVLRTELYGLDGSTEQNLPLTATQSNYTVRLLQDESGPAKLAAFFVHGRETIDYLYERDPADPRVSHSFTIAVDDLGFVTQSCELFYPRRAGRSADDPQQSLLRASCVVSTPAPAQCLLDMRLFGLTQSEQHFEIRNLPAVTPALYFEFDGLSAPVDAALAAGDPGTQAKLGATLLSWQRWTYVGDKDGSVTPQALLVKAETAAFSANQISQLFTPLGLPDDLTTLLSEVGGYHQADGCWWQDSPSETYGDAAQFFLPLSTADAFAAQGNGLAGSVTTYVYDAYKLLLLGVDTTSTANDVLADQVTVTRMDYQSLLPEQIQEANGSIAEVLLDPLGMVIATSHRGREQVNGAAADVGFTALPPSTGGPWPIPASTADAIANAATYLQGASSFIFYDMDSWLRDGTPTHVVEIEATDYPDPGHPNTPVGDIRLALSFDDGHGDIVQSSRKVEPGDAIIFDADGHLALADAKPKTAASNDRWLTSGAIVLNSKRQPYKQYEPFYRDGWAYTDHPHLTSFVSSPTFYYDAMGRPRQTFYQKGALVEAIFSKTEHTPWKVTNWDENDTIKDSALYQTYVAPGGTTPDLPPLEKAALIRAAAHYDTPSTELYSCDGHLIGTIERLSPGDTDALITIRAVDILGRTLAAADPRLRLAGLWNLKQTCGLSAGVLMTESAESGTSYALANALGNPSLSIDARLQVLTHSYDGLHRPVQSKLRDLTQKDAPPRITEWIIYGDSLDAQGHPPVPESEAANLRGHIAAHYDQAGLLEVKAYTLGGSALGTAQRFITDARTDPDWTPTLSTSWAWTDLAAAFTPALDAETFTATYAYNALDEICVDIDAGGNKIRLEPYISGRLKALHATRQGGSEFAYVHDIAYDANGQRTQFAYGATDGSGFITRRLDYDPDTLRLTRLQSILTNDKTVLQDLSYLYDPSGNVTHVQDQSVLTPSVIRHNQTVSPDLDYEFDALYRLTKASGRAHKALTAAALADGSYAQIFSSGANPNDSTAVEPYLLRYDYDASGNLQTMRYISPSSASSPRWTRTPKIAANSNRAVDADALGGDTINSWFDANGNQVKSGGLPGLAWTYRNELRRVTLIDRGIGQDADAQYHTYDGTGQRRRVFLQRKTNADELQTEETLFLGNLEITRLRNGTQVVSESRRWRLMDLTHCIAEQLTWPVGTPPVDVTQPQLRYQLENEQGSAMTEVDAAGRLISYEEYTPHGATLSAIGASLAELSLKSYRYSGRHRDQVTGFCFYGSRYYMPWLGRWLSPDPAGTIDGLNLYVFVRGNPVTHIDIGGFVARPSTRSKRITTLQKSATTNTYVRSRGIRTTLASRIARASARTVAVGNARAAINLHANEGNYAHGFLANLVNNYKARNNANGTRWVADHFPSDFSQRGPRVSRTGTKNSIDTLQRPALTLPKYIHDQHPTTIQGHGPTTTAFMERTYQLQNPNLKAGRFQAVEEHMNKYYLLSSWKNMGTRNMTIVRKSFIRALKVPTLLHDDNGQAVAKVKLTATHEKTLLAAFDASFT
jgi:insecticidal toxin complex protein TccC